MSRGSYRFDALSMLRTRERDADQADRFNNYRRSLFSVQVLDLLPMWQAVHVAGLLEEAPAR